MKWKMSNETQTRGYAFTYDNLSRLTGAGYLENGSANDHFNTSYVYDKQGNMTALTRRGNTGTSTYGLIDNLTMTYAGNQLIKAEDTGVSVSPSASMDFKNNSNTAKEYSYDANGNLIQDLNKGINSITYNLLNLPQTLTISNSFGSATNTYTYAADGRKLSANIGGKVTDYCGNVIYENRVLKRILIEGGYIEDGTYYFYLTDYLGNNRVVADAGGNIKQTNHFYPFGMSFPEGTVTSSQPYKYNGKELDTERGLNLYDYSARYMEPALGRFNTADPMAEKYYSISPYVYVGNNPMRFIDPNGKDIWEINEQGRITNRIKDKTQDAFYMVDNRGNRTYTADQDGNKTYNSISFEYGTIESQRSISFSPDEKTTDTYDIYQVRGDDDGSKLFKFMADNITNSTGIEVSQTKTGQKGERGVNFITTSHELQTENGMKELINGQLRNGYYIREFTHSHPNNPYPSGLIDGSKDIGVIKAISDINKFWGTKEPNYYIYHTPSKKMIQYNVKSVISDFNLIP